MVEHTPADTSSGSHPLSTPLHTFPRSFCIPEPSAPWGRGGCWRRRQGLPCA
uniref:Uncharacterized protein n=1 Tax=Arundo donax TaxID=35708 RepID=A0A0A9GS28_ARUDO